MRVLILAVVLAFWPFLASADEPKDNIIGLVALGPGKRVEPLKIEFAGIIPSLDEEIIDFEQPFVLLIELSKETRGIKSISLQLGNRIIRPDISSLPETTLVDLYSLEINTGATELKGGEWVGNLNIEFFYGEREAKCKYFDSRGAVVSYPWQRPLYKILIYLGPESDFDWFQYKLDEQCIYKKIKSTIE